MRIFPPLYLVYTRQLVYAYLSLQDAFSSLNILTLLDEWQYATVTANGFLYNEPYAILYDFPTDLSPADVNALQLVVVCTDITAKASLSISRKTPSDPVIVLDFGPDLEQIAYTPSTS